MIFESVERGCEFTRADDRQGLIEQAGRQKGDVALWLLEHIEMLVIGFQSLEHRFSFVAGLGRQEAEVFQTRHLSAEDVAKGRARWLATHGWNQVAARREFGQTCEHTARGDDDDRGSTAQGRFGSGDRFFGVAAVTRGQHQPRGIKPCGQGVIAMHHDRATARMSGQCGEEIAPCGASTHAEAEHAAPWRLLEFSQPWKAGLVHGFKSVAKVVVEHPSKAHHALVIEPFRKVDQRRFGSIIRFVFHAHSSLVSGVSMAMYGRAIHSSSCRIKRPLRPWMWS